MIKHLTAHGNSSALILDKAILDLLKITQKTPLQIVTDGRSLIVSPVDNENREKKVKTALSKIFKRHAKTFKKLAE